ncbi:MAG: hypothetical protein KDD82_01445 [Planctomycetes bacterium]|nr:hypothetical protein [Planctomycetota bacterium]
MSESPEDAGLVHAHLRFGWWSLFVFLTLGVLLEALHALKASYYLHPAHETRRLMWTLSHTHGTLLGLMQFAFAATIRWGYAPPGGRRALASHCLRAAGILIPAGFFLAGLVLHGGDPGVGILLVPLGALSLMLGVLLTALNLQPSGPDP